MFIYLENIFFFFCPTAILEDHQMLDQLKLSLAMLIDVGRVFVEATYVLEGDGFLAPKVWGVCNKICSHIEAIYGENGANLYCRNLCAVVSDMMSKAHANHQLPPREGPGSRGFILMTTLQRARPACEYIIKKLNTTLKIPLHVFKGFQLLDPEFVATASGFALEERLDILFTSVPVLRERFEALKDLAQDELPSYVSKARQLDPDTVERDLAIFWKSVSQELPALAKICRIAMLYQPSSAAAERVFSMLKSQFGDRQQHALGDYQSTSIKLRYNRIWRMKKNK
jgi:hypothetical protein